MRFGWFIVVLLQGCILPVSTAKTESAETVGKSNFSFAFAAEAPNVNFLAEDIDDAEQDEDLLATSPSTTYTAGIRYGVSDQLDLGLNLEIGSAAFIFPTTFGISADAKVNLLKLDRWAIGVLGRIGTSAASVEVNNSREYEASATYGALAFLFEHKLGTFRPRLAFNYQPTRVKQASGSTSLRFLTHVVNSTVSLPLRFDSFEIGIFGNIAFLNSPKLNRTSEVITTGLFFSFGNYREPALDPYGPPVDSPPPAPINSSPPTR